MLPLVIDYFRTDYGVTDLLDLSSDYRSSCASSTLETRFIPGQTVTEYDEMTQQELPFIVSDPQVIREHVDWLVGAN